MLCIGCCLLALAAPAQAARTWYGSNPGATTSYTTWNGSTPPAPAATNNSGCVSSIRNNNTGGRAFGVFTNAGNAGSGPLFTLVNTTDPADTLDITLDFTKGGTTVTLDNHTRTGNNAFPGGNSCGTATIDMNVTQGAMLAATGDATYRSTFNLCVVRGNLTNSAGRCSYTGDTTPPSGPIGENFGIQFEIFVPKMLTLAGLDDIIMSYTPGSNATGTDAFCAGRNYNGNLRISASSGETTSTGTFMMAGLTTAAEKLAYSVTVAGQMITEGDIITGTLLGTSDGVRDDLNCTSLTGLDLVVTSQANLVQAASAQTYRDTLTLTVQPE